MNVANKLICLNLNANWQPVGFKTVKDAIIDLCGSDVDGKPTTLALNIEYNVNEDGEPNLTEPSSMTPMSWSNWLELPIRAWDFSISTPNMKIRVPTVIIATNFAKMPMKSFRGKPSKEAIYYRDNGICQYTGKKLNREQSTIDHVIPRSKGGADSWTNMVLCDKHVNSKKGNMFNNEAGLRLLSNPSIPKPMPVSALIKEAKHEDWKHFLIN